MTSMAANYDFSQGEETLSREHPISEFLRNQTNNIKDMTQEEFIKSYEAHIESKEKITKETISRSGSTSKSVLVDKNLNHNHNRELVENTLNKIVLKFTTVSESCNEAPSFTVSTKGANIGSGSTNEIYIPSDLRLNKDAHATINYSKGSFYICDNGYDNPASIRIGVGTGHRMTWYLENNARFSAGNSVFCSEGIDEDGNLVLKVLEGPLKNEKRVVTKRGASFGRSSENTISVPDRELSRKHSRLEYDQRVNKYLVCDVGSTNGTYMQLVGPYAGPFKLSLTDHILVGRTGFSVNRYDYGLSEEIGFRPTMEDACTIVQHLNISSLNVPSLSPQSFFGVFDGHGGNQASHYLSQNLHINIADGLLGESGEMLKLLQDIDPSELINMNDNYPPIQLLDEVVIRSLKQTFLRTDNDFINKSTNSQHGSTATTALILGARLYAANVGDSRVILCRNFKAISMTQDHKPSREDECKRIRDAGGFVINNRVMGELAVSRAFGDSEFKKGIQGIVEQDLATHQLREGVEIDTTNWNQPLIVADPDIQATNISENDQFLLLACDGLFDVFTPEDIVTFVKSNMEEHHDSQRCCQNLTYEAIRKRNSRDNVSVILIILNPWY
uniref:Protein-serine/threonine phosphatase n=1 Tax=Chromulina nebulosa TaxID=96789 RepID=A0A7S0XEJ1_9STRA|mmetsp:Transcript_4635/g.4152  ORF Transcript_4635/g.4152 Transcript_4635/m.4152 type:complete len:616 (+) Transcript_4635:179-2026(+)